MIIFDFCALLAPIFAAVAREKLKSAFIALFTAAAVVSIVFVMPKVFNDIPAARGGGKPESAVLVLNKSGTAAMSLFCGVTWNAEATLTGKVSLLYDSGTQYILWIDGSSLVKSDGMAPSAPPVAGTHLRGGQLIHLPKSSVEAVWLLDYRLKSLIPMVGKQSCELHPLQSVSPGELKKL